MNLSPLGQGHAIELSKIDLAGDAMILGIRLGQAKCVWRNIEAMIFVLAKRLAKVIAMQPLPVPKS